MAAESAANAARVAFIGGGSGGHLFPAMAIAGNMLARSPGSGLLFLTSQRPIDQRVLRTRQWPSAGVRVEPYVRCETRFRLTGPLRQIPAVLQGFRRAMHLLREFRPDVVVGLGAFASVPGVLAARRLKLPIVLLEQNVRPGRATKLLARHARLTIAGLPMDPTIAIRWPGPVVQTGVPIRESFHAPGSGHVTTTTVSQSGEGGICPDALSCGPERAGQGGSLLTPYSEPASPEIAGRLLILGGSQGASRLNHLVLEVLSSDGRLLSDWNIVHQTGETDRRRFDDAYGRQGRSVQTASFIDDLPRELSRATMVISRAGAVTLQEIAACGCPAILIPLSTARDQHQLANARLFADAGSAFVVEERTESAAVQLHSALQQLSSTPEMRRVMSMALQTFARPDAASRAADLILSAARGTRFD